MTAGGWPGGITQSTQSLPRPVDRDSVLRKHRDRMSGSYSILSNECCCTESLLRVKRSETEPEKTRSYGAQIRSTTCCYKQALGGEITHSVHLN